MSEMDSLFNDFYSEQKSQNLVSSKCQEIFVTFAEYKESKITDPDTLFQGFDEMHVITYSLGIEQVEIIMKHFKRGQVIIGSYKSISGDVAEMLALQKYTVNYVSKNYYLQKMIESQNFRFFVTDKVHAKIYLLKSDDERYRVILSSANFSANAWQQRQMENFVVIDGLGIYEDYMKIYGDLRKHSTDEIDINARQVKEDGTNLEFLPALRKAIHSQTAVIIHEQSPESKEAAEYIFTQNENAKQFRDVLQKSNVKTNSDGQTLFFSDNIVKMRKTLKALYEEKQQKNRERNILCPSLILDYDKQAVTFNNELWDLNPDSAEIKSDLENLVKYVEGTKIFTGDTPSLKTIYWKIIIYMFVSPFFAQLRYIYDKIVPANSTGKAFPMYMILRGHKNGGKSSIVVTGQRLMFDRTLPMISAKEIAPIKFEVYKRTIKGCPVLIDEATNRNLQYLKEVVKDDHFLISGKITDHGTFIFTSNDAEQVKQEISKRVVVFTINNQINEDKAVRHDASLSRLQKDMHNALYKFYLAKIFPEILNLIDEINNAEDKNQEWLPDIFKIASETLIKIFDEFKFEVPKELKVFSWKDYLGEEVKSEKAVNTIKSLYNYMPKIFRVDKKNDILIIDLSGLDQKTLAPIRDILEAELPPSTERKIVGNMITMKFSELKKFANISFDEENNLFKRMMKFFNS